jgi:SagB-type dehydrogenase family enzyme
MINPAVRIIPPSGVTENRWLAEHLIARKRYTISAEAAAMLVAACRPQERESLIQRLIEADTHAQAAPERWSRMAESLIEKSLICAQSEIELDPDLQWLVALRRSWSKAGWHEAAEYHLLAFDYPCLDYSEGITVLKDQNRMREYQSHEPDSDRFKLDYLDQPGIELADPDPQMSAETARTVFSGTVTPATVTAETIEQVISLTFGINRMRTPVTDAAPLIHRSSPSGGARHPTEGYLIVRDVPGIDPGWYHITLTPFSLRRLPEVSIEDDYLYRLFSDTLPRFPFDTKALVVFTSTFERNMYRYREPRTFRTVHIDAGHLASTLRRAASSVGLMGGIYYCDVANAVEEALKVNGLQEGYMLTAALADGGVPARVMPQLRKGDES